MGMPFAKSQSRNGFLDTCYVERGRGRFQLDLTGTVSRCRDGIWRKAGWDWELSWLTSSGAVIG